MVGGSVSLQLDSLLVRMVELISLAATTATFLVDVPSCLLAPQIFQNRTTQTAICSWKKTQKEDLLNLVSVFFSLLEKSQRESQGRLWSILSLMLTCLEDFCLLSELVHFVSRTALHHPLTPPYSES